MKRYLAEFHFNSTCVTQGLPLHTSGWTLFPMKCDDAKLLHVCTCINCQVLHIPFLGCKFSINTFLDGLKTMLLPRKVSCLQLFRVEQKKSPISFLFQCNGHFYFSVFNPSICFQMLCMEPIWPYYGCQDTRHGNTFKANVVVPAWHQPIV